MIIKKKINGKRIFLQNLNSENVHKDYSKWLNNKKVNKYLEARHFKHTKKTCQIFIDQNNLSKNDILFGIFEKKKKIHIGNIKIGSIDKYNLRADIGIIIGNSFYWGKGLATEAIKICTFFCFKNLKLKRITAGCYSENLGSAKAFKRAGWYKEGVLRKYWKLDKKHRSDEILLGIYNK